MNYVNSFNFDVLETFVEFTGLIFLSKLDRTLNRVHSVAQVQEN